MRILEFEVLRKEATEATTSELRGNDSQATLESTDRVNGAADIELNGDAGWNGRPNFKAFRKVCCDISTGAF